MKELTRNECAQWLLDRDRFVILTHRKPDGDTLGSSAALCRGLRAAGKTDLPEAMLIKVSSGSSSYCTVIYTDRGEKKGFLPVGDNESDRGIFHNLQ